MTGCSRAIPRVGRSADEPRRLPARRISLRRVARAALASRHRGGRHRAEGWTDPSRAGARTAARLRCATSRWYRPRGFRMTVELRPYQIDISAEFERHVERGDRSILLVAPTGSGKTVIAAAIIAATARRVLVAAHRREIVNQTSDKLTARGVAHGIIQAGDEKKLRPMAAVQVASIQTLHARAIRSNTMQMPLADLLIIDEAHHACAMTTRTDRNTMPW